MFKDIDRELVMVALHFVAVSAVGSIALALLVFMFLSYI
jgi:hypothetical protein